jgi:hypothetical protein
MGLVYDGLIYTIYDQQSNAVFYFTYYYNRMLLYRQTRKTMVLGQINAYLSFQYKQIVFGFCVKLYQQIRALQREIFSLVFILLKQKKTIIK